LACPGWPGWPWWTGCGCPVSMSMLTERAVVVVVVGRRRGVYGEFIHPTRGKVVFEGKSRSTRMYSLDQVRDLRHRRPSDFSERSGRGRLRWTELGE
jgi:hypothetical protein